MSITKLIAELTKLENIAGDAPDINILNYDDDQIVAVNSALNDVYNGISQIKLSIANMVLVPREPTEAMCDAVENDKNSYACTDTKVKCGDCGNEINSVVDGNIDSYMARLVYKAMLSIAEEAE